MVVLDWVRYLIKIIWVVETYDLALGLESILIQPNSTHKHPNEANNWHVRLRMRASWIQTQAQ